MGIDSVARGMANRAILTSAEISYKYEINPAHNFVDTMARNNYFITNPTELTEGLFISVGSGFQRYENSVWVDKTAVLQGAKGDKGDIGLQGTSYTENNIVVVATDKTLALTDATTVQCVTAAATITIPPNSVVAFNLGVEIVILAYTAFDVAIAPGAGVTLYSSASYRKIGGQYTAATIKQIAVDEWVLLGTLKE